MRNILVYLAIIASLIVSPLSIFADGGVIRPMPDGDWTWVDEKSQQAFINYEQGREKLVIAADINKENSDIFWIIPVPGSPENIELDITPELPIFYGDEVMSKAKLAFSEGLGDAYFISISGQIWTLPLTSVFLVSLSGAKGGAGGRGVYNDLVSIDYHIEKEGMIAEVISAKTGRAIYDYFSQKGFGINEGSISELDYYINKDYSFVVSWISGAINEERGGQKGIFISFPTENIYYPLMLTSVYGETEVPIEIRILGHIKPTIYSEIKPYTKVSYFTERTKGAGKAYGAKCQADMSQFRAILELYNFDYNRYPLYLDEMLAVEEYRGQVEALKKDMASSCLSSPFYSSNSGNDYIMRVMINSGLYEINSFGFAGLSEKRNEFSGQEFIPSELQKFYGSKEPWKGEADYTKVTINAPAKLLKQDLLMEAGRPLGASLALFLGNNSWIAILLLYILITGLASFVAGGIVGWLRYHKFKKYALVGLANIATLIGFIVALRFIKKDEEVKQSKGSFTFFFSAIFVLLLIAAPLLFSIFTRAVNGAEVLVVISILFCFIFIPWLVLLSGEFLLGKMRIKSGTLKSLLAIILCVVLCAAIIFLFILFFL